MSNSIKVVARFRPQNKTEIEVGGQPIVRFESEDTCALDVCILYYHRKCMLTIFAVQRCSGSIHL
jgi:hypothetical protein